MGVLVSWFSTKIYGKSVLECSHCGTLYQIYLWSLPYPVNIQFLSKNLWKFSMRSCCDCLNCYPRRSTHETYLPVELLSLASSLSTPSKSRHWRRHRAKWKLWGIIKAIWIQFLLRKILWEKRSFLKQSTERETNIGGRKRCNKMAMGRKMEGDRQKCIGK